MSQTYSLTPSLTRRLAFFGHISVICKSIWTFFTFLSPRIWWVSHFWWYHAHSRLFRRVLNFNFWINFCGHCGSYFSILGTVYFVLNAWFLCRHDIKAKVQEFDDYLKCIKPFRVANTYLFNRSNNLNFTFTLRGKLWYFIMSNI